MNIRLPLLTSTSEHEFCGDLRDAGRRRMGHISKGSAVDVPIHEVVAKELRMVKRVECLESEFERLRLRQPGELAQRDIVVSHPRPIKEPPRGRARSAQCVGTEKRGVEISITVAWIMIELEIAGDHIGKIDTDPVDS